MPLTVESPGLLEDLLEASASVYHKRVTKVQLEARRRIQEHYEACTLGGKAYLHQNPGTNEEQVHSAVELNIQNGIERIHMEVDLCIKHLRSEKEQRDEGIRMYAMPANIEA